MLGKIFAIFILEPIFLTLCSRYTQLPLQYLVSMCVRVLSAQTGLPFSTALVIVDFGENFYEVKFADVVIFMSISVLRISY